MYHTTILIRFFAAFSEVNLSHNPESYEVNGVHFLTYNDVAIDL